MAEDLTLVWQQVTALGTLMMQPPFRWVLVGFVVSLVGGLVSGLLGGRS